MERIVRAQTFGDPEKYKSMQASKTLEINPRHPIIIELKKKVEEDPESNNDSLLVSFPLIHSNMYFLWIGQSTKDLGFILYDTALLTSGFQHDDTVCYQFYHFIILNIYLLIRRTSLVVCTELWQQTWKSNL